MSNCAQPSILDQLAKRARRLYSLPAVALEVLELTRQPRIDTRAVKDCIEQDPALASKILRVVNSSLFGLGQQVADLNQALALLGSKTVKMLVLGFSLPTELLSELEANVLSHYWRRTLIKAVAAREISETVWRSPGDEAFLAGLMQDIGMLALAQDLGESYITFLERIFAEGGDLSNLEVDTMGFHHTQLSAEMLEFWGLPEILVSAVAAPHDSSRIAELTLDKQRLPKILHLAELITEFLIRQQPSQLSQLLDVGQRYRDMSMSQLEALLESLEIKVPQLADVLSLELPGKLDYRSVLLEAYQRLNQVTEDLVTDGSSEDKQSAAILSETKALHKAVERCAAQSTETAPAPPVARPARSPSPAAAALLDEPEMGPVVETDEYGLLNRATVAIARCRQARQAVSLLLAEIDDFDDLLIIRGVDGATRSVRMLGHEVQSATEQDTPILQLGEARLAVFLEGYDRHQAVELARDVVNCFRRWSLERGGSTISVSAGISSLAMPPKNFPTRELIATAERCLGGVQLSGGDGVKSIDIY